MSIFSFLKGRRSLPYTLTIVCPDRNFLLEHLYPFKQGIGGGKTSTLLFTYAARKYFKNVFFIGNVKEEKKGNISYVHLDNVKKIDTDVLLATTSSDLDFSYLLNIDISATIKVSWLHNHLWIKDFDKINWDFIISCSHYVKNIFRSKYKYDNIYTIHNATPWSKRGELLGKFVRRDPYGLVFASAPRKGLDNLIELVKILRAELKKPFSLDIYGGYQLWGLDRDITVNEDFIRFKGNKNLHDLTKALHKYSFMLSIYDFEEPFGMIYTQAMKAGVINVVSNVGGINEYIKSGLNGFLINHTELNDLAIREIVDIFRYLLKDSTKINAIRKIAQGYSRSWDDVLREFCCLIGVKLQ